MVAQQHVPTPAVLRRLVGVAALLGLFAMHGLGMHGTHHAPHVSEQMAQVAQAATAPVALHHGADRSHAPGQDAHHAAGSDDRAPAGALRGLAAMCLAVLLAGIALAVLRRRGVVVPRAVRSGRRSSPRPGGSRPHRDPPCLFTLSVQRC